MTTWPGAAVPAPVQGDVGFAGRGRALRVRLSGVLIELALRGTLGGRAVRWTAVDLIILRNGLIVERRCYFDPLPLFRALLSRPATSLELLTMMVTQKETR